jgi:phosphoribosylformimino-5-aminoimidazole carboxamide ribotide isomerase
MYVIPAIDLIGGKCVRLIQGDYSRQINYEDDPVKQAKEFESAGAKWLHIVDLEAAKFGRPVNTDAVRAICGLGQLKVELGGGIRDENAIRQMFEIGVERVIIGTKAVSDFDWFGQVAEKFPGKIVLGRYARLDPGQQRESAGLRDRSCQITFGGDNIHRHLERRHDGRAEPAKDKGACADC